MIAGERELVDAVWAWHSVMGGQASPFDAWNGLRGIRSMGVRVRHQPQEFLSLASVGRLAYQGLGWSSRAVDDLIAESPRSDFLDSVEQRTQFSTRLKIKA